MIGSPRDPARRNTASRLLSGSCSIVSPKRRSFRASMSASSRATSQISRRGYPDTLRAVPPQDASHDRSHCRRHHRIAFRVCTPGLRSLKLAAGSKAPITQILGSERTARRLGSDRHLGCSSRRVRAPGGFPPSICVIELVTTVPRASCPASAGAVNFQRTKGKQAVAPIQPGCQMGWRGQINNSEFSMAPRAYWKG